MTSKRRWKFARIQMGRISDLQGLFEADLEAVWRLFPIFASRWATGECEGSKWGRIKLEIQWAWSQTCDMCPSHVNTCSFLTLLLDELLGSVRGQESMDMVSDTWHMSVTTLLLDELQGSVRCQNVVEFCLEFNGHGDKIPVLKIETKQLLTLQNIEQMLG